MFKASSTSYSQFLQPKDHFHCLSESSDFSVDVDFFKRSVSLHYQHVYASKKWQNSLYRYIFFGFGFLFLIFGIIVFFKTTNYEFSLYFHHYGTIKYLVDLFCFFLSITAFLLGSIIQPEKEAIRFLVAKVEKELKSPSKHLQIEFNAIVAHLSREEIGKQILWVNKNQTISN